MPKKKKCLRVLSSPMKPKPNNRPLRLRNWTNEAMLGALNDVKNGLSIRRAAEAHGVPKTTLQDRVTGRVTHGTNPGPAPYLTANEENELVDYLVQSSKMGYGKTRHQVMNIAERVAKEKSVLKKSKISTGWFNRFKKRNPTISLRKGDSMAAVRFQCTNEDAIAEYYDLLKRVLDDNDLWDKPGQIYNVDETGMPLDPPKQRIVTKKGQKKVRQRGSGNKSQITVVACAGASGHIIPPFVIFEGKNFNHAWSEGEVAGTRYGTSPKGWIDTELFLHWFTMHFLHNASGARPLLLLMDGHSTHYQPDVIRMARENDVIMLCLPPHTTADSQPLDVAVFKSLKAKWSEVCHQWMDDHPGRVVTKFQFSTLLSQAWLSAMTPANVMAGFRKAGVFPFNKEAISTPASTAVDKLKTKNQDVESQQVFTQEQLVLFERPYSEGYNIFVDSYYVKWLEIHHPEALSAKSVNNSVPTSSSVDPSNVTNSLSGSSSVNSSNVTNSLSGSSSVNPSNTTNSLSGSTSVNSSNVTNSLSGSSSVNPSNTTNSLSGSSSVNPSNGTNTLSGSSSGSPSVNPSVNPSNGTNSLSSSSSVSPLVTTTIVTNTLPSSSKTGCGNSTTNSVISKYLTKVVLPSKPKLASKTGGSSRVLTSFESLKLLEEKELKKKKEAEEKEERKRQREEKRRKKLEEQRLKEVKRLEKKAIMETKKQEKQNKSRKRKDHPQNDAKKLPREKRVKSSSLFNETKDIDENECSVCFGRYEDDEAEGTGATWIMCACGLWLHENCSLASVANATEFCPHCVCV